MRRPRARARLAAAIAFFVAIATAPMAPLAAEEPAPLPVPITADPETRAITTTRGVSALGRLEPKDGIRHVAGPSLPVVVVKELLVDRGDTVTKGQLLATLDTAELQTAAVQEKAA
ncbi:MAG: biotin/lipoyl-binding protein, partial [Candidatus Binatia bacterium]